MKLSRSFCFILTASVLFLAMGCTKPHAGPDKTFAGAVLGAGWGAGAGAVIGNQVGNAGSGAGVGAGLGLIGGALTGMSHDAVEGIQLRQEHELASLRIQNLANGKEIALIQNTLDEAIDTSALGGVYQVFFETEETNLRTGSIANLQVIADSIKSSPYAYKVNVIGHSDDSGTVEYNQRLAESRARSVSAYLAGRGISLDQIDVKSFGAERPIASNSNPTGRQLNRRVDVYISR